MVRLVSAIVVTLVISAILAPFSSTAPSSIEPVVAGISLLQIEGALAWFFAVAVGALVARKNFVLPAVVLSIVLWSIVTYAVYDIARVAEPTSLPAIAAQHLPLLLLMALAAVIGALLGGWFFRRHLEHYLQAT